MSSTDPLATLNPSIVGQAEKAHTAILKKVLAGTTLDERQWITLQLALGGGDSVGRDDLLERVSAAAKYEPADVATAITALTDASLLDELPGAGSRLAVTSEGRDLVSALRARVGQTIEGAYGLVPPDDLATAARVLTTITARLSEELAR